VNLRPTIPGRYPGLEQRPGPADAPRFQAGIAPIRTCLESFLIGF